MIQGLKFFTYVNPIPSKKFETSQSYVCRAYESMYMLCCLPKPTI